MSVIVMKGEKGSEIRVEVAEEPVVLAAPASGGKVAGLGDVEDYLRDFGKVGDYIMDVCREIHAKYQATVAAVRPQELEVEFGIKLGGETGIPFVSKGSAEATIQVKATWK